MTQDSKLPSAAEKPSFLEWLETHFQLPFRLPRIPFVQTAKNLDKAAGSIILAGGENVAARIRASTARIETKSSAEQAFIEYGKANIASGPVEIAERALNYALGEAIKGQVNREEILRIAAEDLAANPPTDDAPQPVDDDWLDAFRRYAETKSDVDIQQLWARILSAEIRKPGSTSLRTLAFLSTVSSAEANFIVHTFTFVLDDSFIPGWTKDAGKLQYGDLLTLLDLGVVTEVAGIGGPQITKSSSRQTLFGRETNFVFLEYYEKVYVFENETKAFSIKLSVCPLSKLGRELFRLTDSRTPDFAAIEEFVKAVKPGDTQRLSVREVTARAGDQLALSPPIVLFEVKN